MTVVLRAKTRRKDSEESILRDRIWMFGEM